MVRVIKRGHWMVRIASCHRATRFAVIIGWHDGHQRRWQCSSAGRVSPQQVHVKTYELPHSAIGPMRSCAFSLSSRFISACRSCARCSFFGVPLSLSVEALPAGGAACFSDGAPFWGLDPSSADFTGVRVVYQVLFGFVFHFRYLWLRGVCE